MSRGVRHPGAGAPGVTPGLIEREQELARIDAALEAARSGTGATVLIEAAAGIGKTSLIALACERAASADMTVLDARASPLERDYAMGVVRQCFERELHRQRDGDALFSGAVALARHVILDVPARSETSPEGVLHGLYWLTANLAERAPVLLAIDDAHWADEESLRFVAYMAGRVQTLPVALVVGSRPPDDPTAAVVLDELRREPATVVLEPAPLEVAGVHAFLRTAQAGPVEAPFAVACHHASGGNPFLLGELVRALRADRVSFTALHADRVTEVTPPTVARSVRATLDRLGASQRALAQAVAVLGDGVDVSLAAELAGVPTIEATFAAGELTRVALLADATPLRFRHPLLAGAVRATLSAPQRAAAHGRAATLLRDRRAGPERVALQLMHAAPSGDPAVVDELRAAAQRARGRGSPSTAIGLLRRALGEPPPEQARAAILLELGRAEAAMGRSADAAAHLQEAYDCAAQPQLRGHAALALFDALGGDMQRVRELQPLVARARAEAAPDDQELATRLWGIEMLCTAPREVLAVHGDARQLAGDTPGEAVALGHLVVPMLYAGATAAEVESVVSRAARQAGPLLEEGATSLVVTAVFVGLYWLDRTDDDGALLDAAVAAARRRGSTAELSLAHSHRATHLRRRGRLGEAEADARIAVAAAGETGWAGGGAGAIIPLVGVLVDQGRLGEADQVIADAHPDGRPILDSPPTNFLLLERASLRNAQGRHAEALEDWAEFERRDMRFWGAVGITGIAGMCAAVEAQAALGDRDGARALAERAMACASSWDAPGYIGQTLHARARIDDDRDAALAMLQQAVAQLRRSPARLELARALLTLGAFLRRRGDRVASRRPLRDSFRLADECRAQPLAEAARAELRASGIRLQRQAADGADGLTPSERRIADMAAEGASNADIAQALFLSVKTVEMHLTRVYRKLAISRRADLPRVLANSESSRLRQSLPDNL